MKSAITLLENAGITSPRGFTAGAVYAGINRHSRFNLDLALMSSNAPCHVAGVFTRNNFQGASVTLCRQMLDSRINGLIVNSGCANAGTGLAGLNDARAMAEAAAGRIGCSPESVMTSSTGVIGPRLPLDRIQEAVKAIKLDIAGGRDMAKAIMTTDTMYKESAASMGEYSIGGITKGAGMIHPDMATMLAFLTTDACIEHELLQNSLEDAVNASFNMISIDGDTSPNDTVLLFANGMAENPEITAGTDEARLFGEALHMVCVSLAKAIARDGEGATRMIEITVTGGASLSAARAVARTIVSSNLVKAAVHGCDPNWGRIVAAAGRSGVFVDAALMDLDIGGQSILKKGELVCFERQAVSAGMAAETVRINLNLNLGNFDATAWGCDLSAEYVAINADYTT